MGVLDAWQRFLSDQGTNLTRQQVAAYQGEIEKKKLAMTYRMHLEKLDADKTELAARLGFNREQLQATINHWTEDRNLRAGFYAAQVENMGKDNAREDFRMFTDIALREKTLKQARELAGQKRYDEAQRALGWVVGPDGKLIPTLEREKMKATNEHNERSLKQRADNAAALRGMRAQEHADLQGYRQAELGQGQARLELGAAGLAERNAARGTGIWGTEGLNQIRVDRGDYDTQLLSPQGIPNWEKMNTGEQTALLNRKILLIQTGHADDILNSPEAIPGWGTMGGPERDAWIGRKRFLEKNMPPPAPSTGAAMPRDTTGVPLRDKWVDYDAGRGATWEGPAAPFTSQPRRARLPDARPVAPALPQSSAIPTPSGLYSEEASLAREFKRRYGRHARDPGELNVFRRQQQFGTAP